MKLQIPFSTRTLNSPTVRGKQVSQKWTSNYGIGDLSLLVCQSKLFNSPNTFFSKLTFISVFLTLGRPSYLLQQINPGVGGGGELGHPDKFSKWLPSFLAILDFSKILFCAKLQQILLKLVKSMCLQPQRGIYLRRESKKRN